MSDWRSWRSADLGYVNELMLSVPGSDYAKSASALIGSGRTDVVVAHLLARIERLEELVLDTHRGPR